MGFGCAGDDGVMGCGDEVMGACGRGTDGVG